MMTARIKHPGDITRGLSRERIAELAALDAMRLMAADKYDPLKIYIELKRYETYLQTLLCQFKEPAVRRASQWGQPAFRYMKADVYLSIWRKLDYSADTEWQALNGSITALKMRMKERESFLKSHNLLRRNVDGATGKVAEEFRLPTAVERRLTIRL